MVQVVVAHATGDAGIGAATETALAAAGLDVIRSAGSPSLKADKASFDCAGALVLVWSRRAAADPGLRREGAAAAARGRLALVRVDAASPPPSLRTGVSIPIARASPQRGLRALAAAVAASLSSSPPLRSLPMTADDLADRSTWKGTLLMAVLLAGLGWGAAWLALGASPAPLLMALLKG